MKHLATACLLSLLATAVQADALSERLEQERQRISIERVQQEALLLRQDRACYERFAVNRCLGKVNVERRAIMADLRRQEVLLNVEERRARGADQLQKLDDKSSLQIQQEDANRRAQAWQDYEARLVREQSKKADRQLRQGQDAANTATYQDRLKLEAEQAQSRKAGQSQAAEEAQKYQNRVQEAQERKAARELQKQQATKPPAPSLPLPSQ